MRAQAAWRDQVEDTTISEFHRRVADSLTRLGVAHTMEGATDDGLFHVDCLLADGRTAVEADGPSRSAWKSNVASNRPRAFEAKRIRPDRIIG